MNKRQIATSLTLACGLAASGAAVAQDQSPEDFYDGLEMEIIVGFNAGSTYDLYSRILAEWLPKFLPGEQTIVVNNTPGAGGAVAANQLFNQADADGSVIGMVSQAAALAQALGDQTVNYDVREFHWLGRLTSVTETTVVWEDSPAKTVEEARDDEVILAASSASGLSARLPQLMNATAGTQFRPIVGYRIPAGGFVAMEQGEVHGTHVGVQGLVTGSPAEWIENGQATVVVQYADERHPAFPDVPAMTEFGDTEADRQVLGLYANAASFGRSFLLPPGVPEDRVEYLGEAFDRMAADPEFQADLEERGLELIPMSGADLQQLAERAVNVSEDVVTRAVEIEAGFQQ